MSKDMLAVAERKDIYRHIICDRIESHRQADIEDGMVHYDQITPKYYFCL